MVTIFLIKCLVLNVLYCFASFKLHCYINLICLNESSYYSVRLDLAVLM